MQYAVAELIECKAWSHHTSKLVPGLGEAFSLKESASLGLPYYTGKPLCPMALGAIPKFANGTEPVVPSLAGL